MGNVARYGLASAGALIIGLLLFAWMQAMIGGQRQRPLLTEQYDAVEFVRLQKEERVEVTKREPPRKPPPPKNPPPPKMPMPQPGKPSMAAPQLNMPKLDLAPRLAGGPMLGTLGVASQSQGLTPLATPQPMYPIRALRLRMEGKVLVEFTVTESGDVTDPEIIKAQPPRIFDQTVKQGVLRWKFKPQIVAGKPVAARLRQTIEFKLPDA